MRTYRPIATGETEETILLRNIISIIEENLWHTIGDDDVDEWLYHARDRLSYLERKHG